MWEEEEGGGRGEKSCGRLRDCRGASWDFPVACRCGWPKRRYRLLPWLGFASSARVRSRRCLTYTLRKHANVVIKYNREHVVNRNSARTGTNACINMHHTFIIDSPHRHNTRSTHSPRTQLAGPHSRSPSGRSHKRRIPHSCVYPEECKGVIWWKVCMLQLVLILSAGDLACVGERGAG